MDHQLDLLHREQLTSCFAVTRCPAQILVLDRADGPANVLVDTISLLMDREVSVLSVDNQADAARALDYYYFDMVVVGLEASRARQLLSLPLLHAQKPDAPILVVGRNLPALYKQYARYYGAREVLNVPERAVDLKTLVSYVTEQYLQVA